MKRDFSAPICDLEGQVVRIGLSLEAVQKTINSVWHELPKEIQDKINETLTKEVAKPLTLGLASCSALIGAYEDERNLADDDRIARMELARKIHKGGVIDITPQERDLIKPLLKKRFGGILIPVVACELLEQQEGE